MQAVLFLAFVVLLCLVGSSYGAPRNPCGLLQVCEDPEGCSIMSERPPAKFEVQVTTTVGRFAIRVETAWAPPFARRFWQLSRLGYMDGARFYRVVSKDFSGKTPSRPPFVVQFGYSGTPDVDNCWDNNMVSNETAPVVAPGNQRGYLSMSMGAVMEKTKDTPYCTLTPSSPYCALGFSTNVFISLGDNGKLDAPGFAIFGMVDSAGMEVVDSLYSGYGEMADLCPSGSTSPYCNGVGPACKGVNMSEMMLYGNRYLAQDFPLMSYIQKVEVLTTA